MLIYQYPIVDTVHTIIRSGVFIFISFLNW